MKNILFYILFLSFTIKASLLSAQDISSASPVVLPQNPATSYVVSSGQTVKITSAQSVTLLPGTHLQAGSNVTINIGNSFAFPVPPSNPNSNDNLNWVHNISYDEDGNVIAESKSFFDSEGKPIQNQVKSLSTSHVLASSPIYDALNRAAINTLPAPINNSGFAFKSDFVKDASGNNYSYLNFDLTKTNNPDAVGAQSIGTLGWYYSDNNTFDGQVNKTNFPYSRTDFYNDGTGAGKRSAMPGDVLKIGSGKESSSNAFAVINELDHYKLVRDKFFNSTEVGESQALLGKAVQTFSVDQNGLESVVINDQTGNALVSALNTDPSWLSVNNNISISNKVGFAYSFDALEIGDYTKELKIKGKSNIIIKESTDGGNSYSTIYDGLPENYVSPSGMGYLYKIESNQNFTVSYKAVPSNGGEISICEACEAYSASINDKQIHYFKLFKPSVVSISGTNYQIFDMSGNEQALSFTSGNTLPAGYYKAAIIGDGYATLSYTNTYSNISYNFYNQLGQVVLSVAPEGVKKLIDNINAYNSITDIPFITRYEYDIQGRLIASIETDAGKSEFVYRTDGNIRFSQNSEQAKTGRFSYTNYDRWSRPIESGEYLPGDISFAVSKADVNLQENIQPNGGLTAGNRQFWVKTYYDLADNSHGLGNYVQDEAFLKGGVSWTENENAKTWYNYDEDGRVIWMIKQIAGLGNKTIDYSYDAKGNVSIVDYQKATSSERFIHEYEYDADGRLKVAYTATVPGQRKEQARYYYYLHGPLKRVELAENLQGLDYTYTPQGWLKAINHPLNANDPGKDGANNSFAPDAFGMTLEYFTGDYVRSGTGISSLASNTNKNYYNGNMVAQSWRSQKPATIVAANGAWVNNPAMFTYEYDEKYQLNNNKYGAPNFGSNTFTEAVNVNREYGLSYDANGNIKTLNRTNTAGSVVNNFGYNYQNNTNKLSSVNNYAAYEYDDLGQLTRQQKGADNVYLKYDVSGKVIAIYADAAHTQLKQSYAYDEAGMRIRKTDHTNNLTTYYVPDASGNVMAIYDNNGTALLQKELPVYAASRVGRYIKLNNAYQYELTDHLGNVRVVLNQNKVNEQADVVYYSDYYPFGSPLTLANNDYRYGYQGQYAEADKETNWNAFELRNYDAAIGRWLSVDPYGQYASPYLGMGNNPVMRVDPDGGWDSPPDWYTPDNGGPAVWKDGSGTHAGFKWLGGENYTFNGQKLAEVIVRAQVINSSKNFLGLNWISQYNPNVPGFGPTACKRANYYMFEQAGYKPIHGNANGFYIGRESGQEILPTKELSAGINYLNSELANGRPVIAGVARYAKGYWGKNYNGDNTTDHFIAIYAVHGGAYKFLDPGSKFKDSGASPNNLLYPKANGMFKGKSYGAPMEITWIGRNNK